MSTDKNRPARRHPVVVVLEVVVLAFLVLVLFVSVYQFISPRRQPDRQEVERRQREMEQLKVEIQRSVEKEAALDRQIKELEKVVPPKREAEKPAQVE